MKPVCSKPPLTLPEQPEHLRYKGLVVPDGVQAQSVLRRVGLYRFKGYLLPCRDAGDYRTGTTSGDGERLMALDEVLRLHVLQALQVVEVGVRQAIIQTLLE